MSTKSTTISSTPLPDPRDTDLVMKASNEKQNALLRSTVDNLCAISHEQELCNSLLKNENEKLRQQIAELQDPAHESLEIAGLKVRIYAMREMLAERGISLATTDRAKLARYIAFMLGSTEKYVERILEQDKPLTDAHSADIGRHNQLSRDINLDVTLN